MAYFYYTIAQEELDKCTSKKKIDYLFKTISLSSIIMMIIIMTIITTIIIIIISQDHFLIIIISLHFSSIFLPRCDRPNYRTL